MIFNDRMMFIHIGKTGGSSCSDYLLHNLQGPAWNCHADADRELAPLGIEGMHPRTDIKRHCTLPEAEAWRIVHHGVPAVAARGWRIARARDLDFRPHLVEQRRRDLAQEARGQAVHVLSVQAP